MRRTLIPHWEEATEAELKNFEKRFQAQVYSELLKPDAPPPAERWMRLHLARWRLGGGQAATERTVLRNLEELRVLVPPRVSEAVLSTMWHRWTTARRYQDLGAARYVRVQSCEGDAEDSIEHYWACPVMRRTATALLRIEAPVVGTVGCI